MAWDKIWDNVFMEQEWGKYPPEELIRFTARNFYREKSRKKIKILDIGCGTGAATWYLAREGFSAFGIDGSKIAIELARKRFKKESLGANFLVGDFGKLPYTNNFFNCVVDVVAIQHNDPNSIKNIISEVFRVLRPGGRFFSMMVAKSSWGDGLGEKIAKNTFINIKKGPFAGKGLGHFFKEKEIIMLLKDFCNINIEISSRTENNQKHKIVHYVVSAEKNK